jgi:hypothetical protein
VDIGHGTTETAQAEAEKLPPDMRNDWRNIDRDIGAWESTLNSEKEWLDIYTPQATNIPADDPGFVWNDMDE